MVAANRNHWEESMSKAKLGFMKSAAELTRELLSIAGPYLGREQRVLLDELYTEGEYGICLETLLTACLDNALPLSTDALRELEQLVDATQGTAMHTNIAFLVDRIVSDFETRTATSR